MSVATTADVAAHLGRELTTAEATRAALLLAAAEALVKARVGDVTKLDQSLLKLVEAQAVARVLRNPDGRYSESLSGEYSYQVDRLAADGVLRIAADEWELLVPQVVEGGAFTISPNYSPGYSRSPGVERW